MKVLFKIFLVFFLVLGFSLNANAITFDEAFEQSGSKPMLVLVYAPWADNYEAYLDNFRALETEFGEKFNYVELDVSTDALKSFNQRYHVYPNLPYVLMFRDNGKVSRYIQKNCAVSSSCMIPRVKSFIQ